ncbi:MAG: hypothetical protein KBF86_14180 [Chitinophagales bacterium]|nr:hypothetical protein [Chitinophagales bacterium]
MNSNDILQKIISAPVIDNTYKRNTINQDKDSFYKEYFKEKEDEATPLSAVNNSSYNFASFNEGGRRRRQHTAKFNTNIINEDTANMISSNQRVRFLIIKFISLF